MLLNFTVKNYKSFADEMCFSMLAAPKQNDLSYSLFKGNAGGENYRVQCSSVIYGPNASGKSNIISAMDTFKAIILRGNIKNVDTTNPNIASAKLELIPNLNRSNDQQVEFTIEFVEDRMRFKYLLILDMGGFLDNSYPRKVTSEELYFNNRLVFERYDNQLKLGDYKYIQKYLLFKHTDVDKMEKIAQFSLDDEELFLTNGFKIIFSQVLFKIFKDWIEHKFIIVYRADAIEMVGDFSELRDNGVTVETNINEASKIFRANTNDIGYACIDENDNCPTLCSILNIDGNNKRTIIPAEIFESFGTVRFTTLLPLVFKAFSTGAILVIDEFDASIHPSALMNIINMFHNDSINKNHAQLIFNTHNPIFLNSSLFRRDEIKFVQRNPDTGSSELYSLSEFGTSGKTGVRNSTDYMKYYLNYRYGAIEEVDFTSIFENIVNNDNTENTGGE